MKKFSKKVFIYIFIGLLTFSSTYISYYKSVHAMEWVGGALAFEEAIKWLLAAIGVVSVGGATADYWENHGEDFLDYCESQNITDSEVAEWQLKLCEGVLDKASDCWGAFKEWASSLLDSVSSGDNDIISSTTINGHTFNSFKVYRGYSGIYARSGYYSYTLNNATVLPYTSYASNNNAQNFIIVASEFSSGIVSNNYISTYTYNDKTVYFFSNYNLGYFNPNFAYEVQTPYDSYISNADSFLAWLAVFGGTGEGVGDNDFISVNDNIENTDILSSDIPDEANPEVSIPMPGITSGDDTISENAYDDFVDQIKNDDRPIDEVIEDIQSLLRVIAYDTDTDDVIPNRPDPDDPNENVKKDDVIKNNKSNIGFTLAGLENVFPFCIPFDIYAFMTLLVADPVAPEFDFPIKSVNNHTEVIHVDLTPFEPVAVVVRYIFDFLFIIGLGILTRSLIGGGSSD